MGIQALSDTQRIPTWEVGSQVLRLVIQSCTNVHANLMGVGHPSLQHKTGWGSCFQEQREGSQ